MKVFNYKSCYKLLAIADTTADIAQWAAEVQ